MGQSYPTSVNSGDSPEVQGRIATGYEINVRDKSSTSGGTRAGLVSRSGRAAGLSRSSTRASTGRAMKSIRIGFMAASQAQAGTPAPNIQLLVAECRSVSALDYSRGGGILEDDRFYSQKHVGSTTRYPDHL